MKRTKAKRKVSLKTYDGKTSHLEALEDISIPDGVYPVKKISKPTPVKDGFKYKITIK